MQYITNLRGTRAFDFKAGTVVALAAGLLLSAAVPGTTQSLPKARALRVIQEDGAVQDVTLDFVAADINDVLKALSVQTHTNIVSGTDVKGNVTVSLAHVSLDEALDMISHLSGYQYAKVGRSYVVGSPASIATDDQHRCRGPADHRRADLQLHGPASLTETIKGRYPAVMVNTGKAAGVGRAHRPPRLRHGRGHHLREAVRRRHGDRAFQRHRRLADRRVRNQVLRRRPTWRWC